MTWQKGQSGNIAGRTPEDRKVKRLARQHTDTAIARLVDWLKSDNPKASVAAACALLDRGYGKPKQAVDVQKTVTHQMTRESVADELARIHARLAGAGERAGVAADRGAPPTAGTTH